ncbi:acetolactate synthase, regulatory subunit [Mucor velutinosus]|uniref:Acetolactate synthase, regulatory subunit n=1 Tax=Mucor velutinosus TaxID=708070 RepID=A0AAN7DCP2_9FUNG|nr:acetolactate synthase, regulatory subunit [Mucor velutinosus]
MNEDEQQSFQALKSRWAQQAKQEQPPSVVSPPPIPPKPTAALLHKVHVDEDPTKRTQEQTSNFEDAAKKVSLLTQQFEKQKMDVAPGNFSNASSRASSPPPSTLPALAPARTVVAPVLTTPPKPILKKAPAPPPPSGNTAANVVQSPPSFDNDPFTHDDGSSDGDSDIEETEEGDEADMFSHENSSSSGDGDNLIEQVHKAHLKYTKLEETRFIGAPGVRNHDLPSAAENNQQRGRASSPASSVKSSTVKKPPPPPPPSKKYHSSARGTIAPTTAAPATAAPIIQHPPAPPPVVASIPMRPKQDMPPPSDATIISPPVLPPRPPPGGTSPLMPQLPPRPSQSTLARAHTIASGSHSPQLKNMSPSSTYSDPPSSFSDYDEEDSRSNGLKRANTVSTNKRAMSRSELLMTSSIYPDFSKATRNAPSIILEKPFSTGHKASLSALAASRNLIITGSGLLRTWDAQTGSVISTIVMDANSSSSNASQNNGGESNDRIRAVAVAPCRIPVDEGRYIWVARQDTMLAVVDIRSGGHKVLSKRNDVHMAPILFLLRYGNSEIWSIDDGGVLNVWDVVSADYHSQQNPLLTAMPRRYHVTSHAVAAVIYGSKLWMSSGRTLSAHAIPIAGSQVGSNDTKSQPPIRIPNDMGNITKLMTIPYHPYRIFASHDDGKISMWDANTMERLQVITVSMYGICTMASVGEYHVWAGYNTGMIYVYDTRPEKWVVLKMWKAHTGAVTQLVVDESSLLLDENRGRLQVVSSDSNGFVGVWDGLLTEHWKDDHLQKRASEYCTYDDARVMICSWNIDANKPEKILGEDDRQVREWLGSMQDPDIIVVGIQEIVDLESKKQTARSLFFKKKVDPHETEEVLTHRYKLWHDYLVRIIGENYGPHTYTVIKTDQLVGLFSCIFVRTTDVDRVFDVDSTSVKTGLKVMNKSIHGNKGGIAIRFVYDHSSLCFVNCHLAAGQSHVQQRNADAEGILQTAGFPRHEYADVFSHGGDGSMVLDHEFCFLSGDLNYRIKMPRNEVLKILINPDKYAAWEKLQVQDQLLRQKINNPLFKLLTFEEAPIHFDPTYKYDPGTDFYDRSEKMRVPAWCDRVLYKGHDIKNLYYRRFEPRCSDHRPIAAGFSFKTKITDPRKRDQLMVKVDEEWRDHLDRFVRDKKARYVADYERCTLNDAFNLLDKSDWDVNDTVIRLLGAE